MTVKEYPMKKGEEPAVLLADEIKRVTPQLVSLTNVINDKLKETHSDIYKIVNEGLASTK